MTKGQRIKSKREELNISQTDFAKKINVSKQTLYKYENDIVTNIPSDKLEKIASVLGVDPAYLMGWEDFEIVGDDAFYYAEKAKKFYSLYEQASPEVRSAVELLLRSAQHSPESQPKN